MYQIEYYNNSKLHYISGVFREIEVLSVVKTLQHYTIYLN